MCRFYALRATAPTRVECCLVQAPNSLLAQSRQDLRGLENGDGWGIAAFGTAQPGDGTPQGKGGAAAGGARSGGMAPGAVADEARDGGAGHQDWVIERHPRAAHDGHLFKVAAARTLATTVLAHVRHATVGTVALENTHPFRHAGWSFVHNGTVPYFVDVRDRLLGAMSAPHRAAIRGTTDSEHLFHLILSTHAQAPGRPLLASLQQALRRVVGWCREIGQEPHLGLNVLLSDGVQMVGSRWQRTLFYAERAGRSACPVCGQAHAASVAADYRALVIASEPITGDPWPEVPERSVFEVTPEIHLRSLPLDEA